VIGSLNNTCLKAFGRFKFPVQFDLFIGSHTFEAQQFWKLRIRLTPQKFIATMSA
jgi:hypothetical protein